MKYLIGTGHHAGEAQTRNCGGIPADKFYQIWWENTMKYAKPERVIVLASGGHSVRNAPGQWIPLSGDLGHVHDLNEGRKPYHWCGWSIAFVTLALLAYFDECDFIFKEEDVLAFGPWVDKMYAEIGSSGMIFGSAKCMPAVQSLVLCKHWFIPEFVQWFMASGSEQIKSNEGELKFLRLEKRYPGVFARYSFGFDRDKPINFDAPIFYGQHWTPDEIAELKRRKLI